MTRATMLSRLITAYGQKYHAQERWAEYTRTVKKARAEGKGAQEIGGILKQMAVQWFRQEERARRSKRATRECSPGDASLVEVGPSQG